MAKQIFINFAIPLFVLIKLMQADTYVILIFFTEMILIRSIIYWYEKYFTEKISIEKIYSKNTKFIVLYYLVIRNKEM